METRRTFVSFATRVDPQTRERVSRIQRATGCSLPKLLEMQFRHWEEALILPSLSDEERIAYFARTLDPSRYEAIRQRRPEQPHHERCDHR